MYYIIFICVLLLSYKHYVLDFNLGITKYDFTKKE